MMQPSGDSSMASPVQESMAETITDAIGPSFAGTGAGNVQPPPPPPPAARNMTPLASSMEDESVAALIKNQPFTDPPPLVVQLMWSEVQDAVINDIKGKIKSINILADSLECALYYLEMARRYHRNPAHAREFVDTCMLEIVRNLLQNPQALDRSSRHDCMEQILSCSVQIVFHDLQAPVDGKMPNLEVAVGTVNACHSLEVLGHIFNWKQYYYTSEHGYNYDHSIGVVMRKTLVYDFHRMGGFTTLAMYLNATMSTPEFPHMHTLCGLLDGVYDVIISSVVEEQVAVVNNREMAKLITTVVMEHMLSLVEWQLALTGNYEISLVRNRLQIIFIQLSQTNPHTMEQYFHFWRRLIFKLLSAKLARLKLWAWSQMETMINACIPLNPPLFYVVCGAGNGHLDGRYDIDLKALAPGREGPPLYRRHIPSNYSDSEWAGKTITLFKITIINGNERWFLSEADKEQPGTEKDIVYYQQKSAKNIPFPSLTGWTTCKAGLNPAPTLEADQSKTPFFEEHKSLLGSWVIEKNLLQHALDSVHKDAIDISVEIIRAAGRTGTGVYSYLSALLHGKAATPDFPSFGVVEKLLKLCLEEDRVLKEDVKLLADAVTKHILDAKWTPYPIEIDKIRSQLLQIYKSLNEANQQQCDGGQVFKSLMMQEYFDFRQAYALKLITSNDLSLALLGWDETDSIIEEIKAFNLPPKSYIVTSAGTDFFNGIYEILPACLLDDGDIKPNTELVYYRNIAVDDASQEIAGKVLIFSRRLTHWYLSVADSVDHPGSINNAVDYYRRKMGFNDEMPEAAGRFYRYRWSLCEAGSHPTPELKRFGYVTAQGEEGNTLEHLMGKWAIENEVVELALGISANSKVVAKSTGLMKLLAEMSDQEDPSDFPGTTPVVVKHLLTAENTCIATSDRLVLVQMYHLLKSLFITESVTADLEEIILTIIETIVLRRIQLNDPTLLQLEIGFSLDTISYTSEIGVYAPKHRAELVRLCHDIGSNSHLEHLRFDGSGPEMETMSTIMANTLCEGLKQNESIQRLSMHECNLSHHSWHQIFNAITGNNTLASIDLTNCVIDARAISYFGRCDCINRITLNGNNLNSALLGDLAQAIRGNSLTRLKLGGNEIGRISCDHIASLLEDPRCNIVTLDLDGNQIDNSCIITLGSALSQNTSLRNLFIKENEDISEIGWDSICQVLCNTSSMNGIFSSNHTLRLIRHEEVGLIGDLTLYLDMNKDYDKRQVAKRKILYHFKDFDMKPFFGLELKMLVLVISWLRDVCVDDDSGVNEEDIRARKLSIMYQFTRAMPMMIVQWVPPITVQRTTWKTVQQSQGPQYQPNQICGSAPGTVGAQQQSSQPDQAFSASSPGQPHQPSQVQQTQQLSQQPQTEIMQQLILQQQVQMQYHPTTPGINFAPQQTLTLQQQAQTPQQTTPATGSLQMPKQQVQMQKQNEHQQQTQMQQQGQNKIACQGYCAPPSMANVAQSVPSCNHHQGPPKLQPLQPNQVHSALSSGMAASNGVSPFVQFGMSPGMYVLSPQQQFQQHPRELQAQATQQFFLQQQVHNLQQQLQLQLQQQQTQNQAQQMQYQPPDINFAPQQTLAFHQQQVQNQAPCATSTHPAFHQTSTTGNPQQIGGGPVVQGGQSGMPPGIFVPNPALSPEQQVQQFQAWQMQQAPNQAHQMQYQHQQTNVFSNVAQPVNQQFPQQTQQQHGSHFHKQRQTQHQIHQMHQQAQGQNRAPLQQAQHLGAQHLGASQGQQNLAHGQQGQTSNSTNKFGYAP